MTVVADENIPHQLIETLRTNGFDVLSIREAHRGIDDRQVIELVKNLKGVLLTEDKDFGEWVFVHGVKELNIVLLRYNKHDFEKVLEGTLKVLQRWKAPQQPLFAANADIGSSDKY